MAHASTMVKVVFFLRTLNQHFYLIRPHCFFTMGYDTIFIENWRQIAAFIGLVCFFYLTIRSWLECQYSAEKLKFFSKHQSRLILIELGLISIISLILLFIDNSPIRSPILNITSSTNYSNVLTSNQLGNIPVFIGIITIVTIYLYFFSLLGKTKYFSERTEEQEKYSSIFFSLPFCLIVGGFILYFVDFSVVTPNFHRIFFNSILLLLAGFNILITAPISNYLSNFFYCTKSSPLSSFGKPKYNYEFIDNFRKLGNILSEDLISENILIITILLFGFAFFFECSIFLLLLTEFCLLIAHFWSSQLRLIPRTKVTIELIDTDSYGNYIKIPDLFILSDSSNGYFVVLGKNNQLIRVMKNSINKLIDQKEPDGDSPVSTAPGCAPESIPEPTSKCEVPLK